MKNKVIILSLFLLALLVPSQMSHAEQGVSHELTLAASELQAGLFGWGKPKYKIKKIQRQNSPKRKNKRNKKLLKKWGLAEYNQYQHNPKGGLL
jgi:hypothetical protein